MCIKFVNRFANVFYVHILNIFLTNFIHNQMTKDDHLSDATGLLAEKVANAVALVMLTFTPEIENDYSNANDMEQ